MSKNLSYREMNEGKIRMCCVLHFAKCLEGFDRSGARLRFVACCLSHFTRGFKGIYVLRSRFVMFICCTLLILQKN
jgi:hypothetical protein